MESTVHSLAQTPSAVQPDYHGWLRGSLIFLGLLVVGRFVFEMAGVPPGVTRFLSSSALIYLVAIYLGAIAPLHKVKKLVQLIIPSLAVATWTVGWVILFTLVSGIFRLQRSHFAEKSDYGNWANLGTHVLEHAVEGTGGGFVGADRRGRAILALALARHRRPGGNNRRAHDYPLLG